MQWAQGKNLGFSTGDPASLYIPVDNATDAPTVDVQEKDPNSLLNKFRKLVDLKGKEAALTAYAEFVPVFAKENTYPYIYSRASGNEVILCIFNPADRAEKANFKLNVKAKGFTLLLGDEMKMKVKGDDYTIETPAISYALYKLKL